MDDPVRDEEDLDNEEIDQEVAEEEKLLKQARKDRKFSPLFCFFMVPLMASFKLKEMAETHESTGDISVLIQGLAQTYVILHRDMVNNVHSYKAGILLWMINFLMFGLDLFDTATLGIYANPVPEDSNVMWTMLVRGLGPFNVFYRFHSLAIIGEVIELPLHQ